MLKVACHEHYGGPDLRVSAKKAVAGGLFSDSGFSLEEIAN
jgi:hypothetical protein